MQTKELEERVRELEAALAAAEARATSLVDRLAAAEAGSPDKASAGSTPAHAEELAILQVVRLTEITNFNSVSQNDGPSNPMSSSAASADMMDGPIAVPAWGGE